MSRPDLFIHTMNQLLNGAVALEASEKLTACVERCRDTGKKAVLTVKLTVKPVGRDTGQYEIKDSITTALPEYDRGITLMFGTPEGNLQREDPRQQKLDLKPVPDDKPTEFKNAENN